MGELEEKISALLSSPDGVDRLLSTARALSDGLGKQEDAPKEEPEPEVLPAMAEQGGGGGLLASLLGGGEGGLKPEMLSTVMGLLSTYNREDERVAVLQALKPCLREERRGRIDNMTQILRVARVCKSVIGGRE